MEDKERKQEEKQPEYIPPKIITYTGEEILEEIGPAQACGSPGCVMAPGSP